MEEKNLILRNLHDFESDYRKLEEWYKKKEVYTYFEQRILSYEEIVKKYKPRTKKDAKIPVFIIELNNKAIGIVQYQLIDDKTKDAYNLNNKCCFEIDIFIGELNLHNKGIGTKCINLISDYLFKEKNADVLVMCPLSTNIKAIKCYEKCGYTLKNKFKDKDTIGNIQTYSLMILERP